MSEDRGKIAMGTTERRSSPRHASNQKGFLVLNGMDIDLHMHNLSSGGGLLECLSPRTPAEGDEFRIYLDSGYVGNAIVCRREEDFRVAVKLKELLPEKSTCSRPDVYTIDEDTSGCFVRKDPIGLAECLFPKEGCRWGIPQCGAVLCVNPSASQFPDADSAHIGAILNPIQDMRED